MSTPSATYRWAVRRRAGPQTMRAHPTECRSEMRCARLSEATAAWFDPRSLTLPAAEPAGLAAGGAPAVIG
jgi:hypothetical protein